ncbi:MAG: nucleotidyltransferase domain-containing protein [Ignavibacteria bacterium]|nr:nucleotidyltransferase domain-containing protein [Ignavibacteria bacterium]
MALRTTKEISEIVRRYRAILLEAGFPLERIILFGSFARNKQKVYSDIDVAVVLKNYSSDRFIARLELMKYYREFEEVIEPHPFLTTEFDKSDPLVCDILENGIEVSA